MPRKRKKIPQTISLEQLKKILFVIMTDKNKNDITPIRKFYRFRSCMMIYMSYFMGLRPKEVYAAKLEHLNMEKKALYIPAENNKQRNEDLMPIPEPLIKNLIKYLELRKIYFPNNIWLFPSCRFKKEHIDRSSYEHIFRRAVKLAGFYQVSYIDKKNLKRGNLTLYSLRHSFGSSIYEKTKDIRKTAIMLRHYDWQYRSALLYIHTTEQKSRKDMFDEIF